MHSLFFRYNNVSSWRLGALALFFFPAACLWAQQLPTPDYDNVDDILYGQHSLLRIDDLVMTYQISNKTVTELQYKTSNSNLASATAAYIPVTGQKTAGPVASANMFQTGGPVLVLSFEGDYASNASLVIRSADTSKPTTATTILGGSRVPTPIHGLTVADFNGDGLDDVVVETNEGLQACTARDPKVFDLQLRCGPLLPIPTRVRVTTNGDFKGDGKQRLAVVGQHFGTAQTSMWILEVDPQTLQISTAAYETQPVSFHIRSLAIASGRFTLAGKLRHDQFAFAYQGDTGNIQVATVDVANSSLQPQIRKTWDSGIPNSAVATYSMILKRAHFNWFSPYDQLVFVVSSNPTSILSVLVVNPDTLAIRQASAFGQPSNIVSDVAIGNFDRNTRSPNGETQHDPNLQMAVSFLPTSFSNLTFLSIFNVDPSSDFKIGNGSSQNLKTLDRPTALSVVAVDTQDRSIELGPVTKIVINNQGGPSLVTAVPPMHVDYVAPAGTTTPTLLNLSAVEKGFSTSYKVESTSREQSTTKSTDSYSFGLEESLKGQLTIGDPKASHLSAGLKFAAKQTFEDGVAKQNTSSAAQNSLLPCKLDHRIRFPTTNRA